MEQDMAQPKCTLFCRFCGSPFTVIINQRSRARYCSRKCRVTQNRKDRSITMRLWGRVNASTNNSECWPWTGKTNHDGYGQIRWKDSMYGTHRVVYQLTIGPIPGNLRVLHRCDNPPCCNPDHLFVGTQPQN